MTFKSSCPYCGGEAVTTDGHYHWGDMLWEAIKQPGITPKDISTFKEAIEEVLSGARRSDEVAASISQISTTFANILRFLADNDKALTIILAILSLLLATTGLLSNLINSSESHDDAQAQLQATERQTKAVETAGQAHLTAEQVREMFDAQIAALNAVGGVPQTNTRTQQTSQGQRLTEAKDPTRQQRRRAEQLERKRERQAWAKASRRSKGP